MTLSKHNTSSPSRADRILIVSLRTMAALTGAISILIVYYLVRESVPLLRSIGPARFVTDPAWHPTEGSFNLLPMVWGTLAVSLGAMLIAVPLGFLSALFCHFYAPKFVARQYRRLIELLAGIPSVVYGFWGLTVVVPMIARLQAGAGPNLLAGILILTLMILPTIALMSDSAIASVPKSYLSGTRALGLTRWASIRSVVIPSARSGLFTAVLLAMGRAVGETMAVIMVCGNVIQTPKSLFDPMRTLTANIAMEMGYALGDHRSALFVSGLVLMAMVILLVGAAEIVSKGKIYG